MPFDKHPKRTKPRNFTRLVDVDMKLVENSAARRPSFSSRNSEEEKGVFSSTSYHIRPMKEDHYVN